MSAGAFVLSKYDTDAGGTCNIRVQPETLALTIGGVANAGTIGEIDQEASANVSGSRRQNGVHARLVRLRFTGAVPTGYLANGTISLPALQKSFYDNVSKGDTGEYLGVAVQVVGKTPERVV